MSLFRPRSRTPQPITANLVRKIRGDYEAR
jgi:hypothetical protein